MFRFEYTNHLLLLWGIPILVVLFIAAMWWRKRVIQRLGEQHLISRLMIGFSKYKHALKFGLFLLGMAVLVIGYANPQWGAKTVQAKRSGIDIFIALDISQSMLAEDIPPNRMERARKFAQHFSKTRLSDRVGIIVFAGNAFLQMPLTSDKSATNLFLKSANPNMAPSQGTAIGDAIRLADESYPEENLNAKVLVIITDGENHDTDAIAAAEKARANGLRTFVIGVGTAEGGYFVDINAPRKRYKIGKNGKPVRSRLNEDLIRDLANAGGGTSYLLNDSDAVIEALAKQFEKVQTQQYEEQSYTQYESHFQIFVGLAMFILLLEFLLSYRRNRWMEGKDFFS